MPESAERHAVVTAGTNTYCYDANGNMVRRVVAGSTYTLSYDQENRLVGVSGAATATFVYDGEGRRVQAMEGNRATVYIGNYYDASHTNRAYNPSLELAGSGGSSDAAGWMEGSNHTRSGDRVHGGSWALKSTYTGSGTATRTGSIAVEPNTTYLLSGWIYKAATSGNAYLDLNDLPGEPQLMATQTNTWQFVSGSWNSGTNTSVVIRLATDGSPNGSVWFDDVSLVSLDPMQTSYYYAGEQRVAMRRSRYLSHNGLFFLLGDHLGSTSVTASSSGGKYGEVRYKPWGEDRYTEGVTPTSWRFTGQRQQGST